MKKLLAIIMVLIFALMVVACEKKEPDSTPSDSAGGDSTDQPAVKIKIGIISNTTTEDGGWGTALYDSVTKVKSDLSLEDDQVVWIESIYDGTEDVDNMVDQLAREGCNIIMAHSAGYVDQLKNLAAKHKDVYFCGYECPVEGFSNYAMYSINDEAASFLCGFVAAKMSDSNNIGYIGNMPTNDLICCLNAFSLGAKYANKDAKVKIIWINSWYDPATEKEAANTLLGSGYNVIGYMGSTASVAQACSEKGAYTTGMYIDMKDYAPDAVLTSHVFDWTLIIKRMIEMASTNSWSTEPIIYGFKDGAARVANLNTDIVPENIAKEYEEVKQKLISGELEVFAGPLYDNTGVLRVKEGESLSPAELIYIDFLVDNIDGMIP